VTPYGLLSIKAGETVLVGRDTDLVDRSAYIEVWGAPGVVLTGHLTEAERLTSKMVAIVADVNTTALRVLKGPGAGFWVSHNGAGTETLYVGVQTLRMEQEVPEDEMEQEVPEDEFRRLRR